MRLLMLFMLMSVATCKKDPLQSEWSENFAKWNKKELIKYEFTIMKFCFCPVAYIGPFQVEVERDQVVRVNGIPYDPSKTGTLWTINSLFDFIKSSLDKKPAKQAIQYNVEWGYPESIFFDFDERIADEEIRIEVKNFKVIE